MLKKNNINKIIVFLLTIILLTLTACSDNAVKTIEPIYRSEKEWNEIYQLEEYNENEKLNEVPKDRPSVTCVNGTFVGNNINGIDIYKGIPFAKAPIGELRFKKAQPVDSSNDIYDASYFGVSFMQPKDLTELGSLYEMGEDCLKLNVWNNKIDNNDSKPVLVFIHGGGFVNGGTADPLYNGYNFVYYNPDIILVTITYRGGLFGFINLSDFEGSNDYQYSKNNGFYDQIEALRWIKNNIKEFGGDPDNITICGESAGGCAVSTLCVMDEAKGLFNKAIPMSGAVNLCVPLDQTKSLPDALHRDFNINTVKELQDIPYEKLSGWWSKNYISVYNNPSMDGLTLNKDLFELYKNGSTKDLIILQGHTKEEFRYYYTVFSNCLPMYDEVCNEIVNLFKEKSNGNFDELYEEYKNVLMDLGYKEEDVNRCFADDLTLAFANTYQAILHSHNNGKGYSYTFEIPYDFSFDDFRIGAAHASDCFFLFGNFDGDIMKGTNEQVDASIRFQRMIANFCKNGDPSIEELDWPIYDEVNRNKMIISLNESKVIENPEKERIDILLEMIEQFDSLYFSSLAPIINNISINNPEIMKIYTTALANNN